MYFATLMVWYYFRQDKHKFNSKANFKRYSNLLVACLTLVFKEFGISSLEYQNFESKEI